MQRVVPENSHTSITEGIGNSKAVGLGRGGVQRHRKFQSGVGLDDKNHILRGEIRTQYENWYLQIW